jgi:transposase
MPSKRSGGRTTKLTPEVQASIVQSVMAGVPQEDAAQRAGIGQETFYRWVRSGKKTRSGAFREFWEAIKKAHSERIAASVARIGKAAQGGAVIERTTKTVTRTHKDGTSTTTTTAVERVAPPQWTADAWYLERRHPEKFAANSLETKELRKVIADLTKALRRGRNASK